MNIPDALKAWTGVCEYSLGQIISFELIMNDFVIPLAPGYQSHNIKARTGIIQTFLPQKITNNLIP